jgi:multidrug resistance efflux pump
MQSLYMPMLRLKGLLMPTTPRHSRRWVVLVALLALATIFGANYYLYFRERSTAAENGTPVPEEPAVGVDSVVCFGHVDVEYGVQSLSPLQSGRVDEVFVHDGDPVKADAKLLRLDDRQAKHQLQEAEADLKAAQAQREEARSGVDQHRAKVAQQGEAIEAAQARVSAAKSALKKKEGLFKDGQLAREDLDAAADVVKEAEAALRGEQEKKRELLTVDPELLCDRAEANVVAKEARRDQARHALDECTLRAPGAGEVLRVLVGVGDVLGPQSRQPAVLFCPKRPRIIRAEVSQEFASRVRVGQPASIQDDTDPNSETWRGKVIRVSNWYTQRRSIMQEPLQVNDVRTLECIIAVESPNADSLRIGQRMRIVIGGAKE